MIKIKKKRRRNWKISKVTCKKFDGQNEMFVLTKRLLRKGLFADNLFGLRFYDSSVVPDNVNKLRER